MNGETENIIRQLGARRGFWSLSAICRAAEIDRHSLRNALRGTSQLRPATLDRLARALGVPAAMLADVLPRRS